MSIANTIHNTAGTQFQLGTDNARPIITGTAAPVNVFGRAASIQALQLFCRISIVKSPFLGCKNNKKNSLRTKNYELSITNYSLLIKNYTLSVTNYTLFSYFCRQKQPKHTEI